MKALKKACPAGFGSTVPRFGNITGHPSLDPTGVHAQQRDVGCDPCRYHPKPMNEMCRLNRNRKDTNDVWRYKTEMEDWSKNLGYRNGAILRYRRWMASVGGPAWCDPHEPPKNEPVCKNLGFGMAPRFGPSKSFTPPPGTYYKAKPFKAPYGPHSILPTFEWGEPDRFTDTVPLWSLAPNRYKIVDKESIEMKSKKVVSLRGPYDLFTGKRDNSTIKNHFSRSTCHAATWPGDKPGSFEKYKKSHFGVMNKTGRDHPYRGRNSLIDNSMAKRLPSEPGPADLNLNKPKVFNQNKFGFNSSYERPPGYKRVIVWPGVGRYQTKLATCGIIGHGHKHVFLSKQKRTIGAVLPEPMNSF